MAIIEEPVLTPPDAIVDTDVAVLLRDGHVGSDGRTYEEVLGDYRNPVLTFLSLAELRHVRHLEERQEDMDAWDQHIGAFSAIYPTSEICDYWGRLTAGDAFMSPLAPSWFAWQATMCLFLDVPLITDTPTAYSSFKDRGLEIVSLRWQESED